MIRKLLQFFLSFAVVLSVSCSGNSSGDGGKHLVYFGFALTDCGVDDPHDALTKTNYIDEVDDFVNLADIYIDSFGDISARIDVLTQNGNKVYIHIAAVFVEIVADAGSPTGVTYNLYPDYLTRWDTWLAANPSLDPSDIACFSLPDEPAWNVMDMGDLSLIAQTIKTDFPTVPVSVIEAGPAVDLLVLNDYIDWVGFDNYGVMDPENDVVYLGLLADLKTKRTNSSQKIIIVMESQWLDLYTGAGYVQADLIPMAQSYYNLAKKESDVIALISYLLPGGFDEPSQLGFRNLDASVQTAIENIGSEITGN